MKSDESGVINYWFRTRTGRIVVGQTPNAPLVTWFLAKVLQRTLPNGRMRDSAAVAADGALTHWALLELFDGVNRFRRVMGFAVLVGLLSSKFCRK